KPSKRTWRSCSSSWLATKVSDASQKRLICRPKCASAIGQCDPPERRPRQPEARHLHVALARRQRQIGDCLALPLPLVVDLHLLLFPFRFELPEPLPRLLILLRLLRGRRRTEDNGLTRPEEI